MAIPSVTGGRSPAFDLFVASRRDSEPTLSDQLLFTKDAAAFLPKVPRKVAEAVKQAHRSSRAFVFDRAASFRVGENCATMADLIADNQEFARAPFPHTFIELDTGAVLDGMEAHGLRVIRDFSQPMDDRQGFLFAGRSLYIGTGGYDERGSYRAMWSPWIYRPHQPLRADQERRFMAETGLPVAQGVDRWLWGNAYDLLDPSRRRSLRAQHGIDLMVPEGWSLRDTPLRGLLGGGGAGDLKVALAAVLMLIRPNLLETVQHREASRRLVRGRPTTFLAHRVVTVKLDQNRMAKRILRACKEERGRAAARWHEVRGHYCHNRRAKAAQCAHDWQEVAPLKWECGHGCGGLRWWREFPNGRGDASIGVVTKHYKVKP